MGLLALTGCPPVLIKLAGSSDAIAACTFLWLSAALIAEDVGTPETRSTFKLNPPSLGLIKPSLSKKFSSVGFIRLRSFCVIPKRLDKSLRLVFSVIFIVPLSKASLRPPTDS